MYLLKGNYRLMARLGHGAASRLARYARPVMARILGGLVLAAPVWADDTEIFFGGQVAGVQPNVLVIVDTSGSMRNEVPGTDKTRLQNVQDALVDLLNNLNGVNVGLMRFSNPGGPVLHQIADLDARVGDIAGPVAVRATVERYTDDAQQVIGSTAYSDFRDAINAMGSTMLYAEARLDITQTPIGSAEVLNLPMRGPDDDAEEETWGTGDNILRRSDVLSLTHRDGDSSRRQVVGVRFAGAEVPPGATITNAYVTFKVAGAGTGGTAEVTISGEYGRSEEFDDIQDNISERARTGAAVEWDLTSAAVGELLSTPDLSAVVQDIISHPDWSGDGTSVSDMTFIMEQREGSAAVAEVLLQAYDGGDFIPTLTVEYHVGEPPADQHTALGLRFTGVDVPRGAAVTGAYVDFTVAQTTTAPTSLAIAGELSASPATYSDAARLSSRSYTSSVVGWPDVAAWETPGEIESTPDLKDVVQQIVNLPDWCGGNPMAFVLLGEGLRSAHAYDAGNGLQPVLRVSYDLTSVEPGASCAVTGASMRITSSGDDVEERGNRVWTSGNSLDFTRTDNHVGLRFPGINVPRGAVISSAWIELTSRGDYTGETVVRIEREESNDAEAFDGNNGTVDDRSWSAGVDWVVGEGWSTGASYRTVDIRSLVQATVNRAGWSSGADMAFRLRQMSGTDRSVDSFDAGAVDAPRLVIEFQDDGTALVSSRLVREELLEQVDQLNHQGYTPIQDTLLEAALYYTGGEVLHGRKRGGPNDNGPHSYTRVSTGGALVADSYRRNLPTGCTEDNLDAAACANETLDAQGGSDPLYESPIVDWCQKESHIILLTDGEANRPHSEERIREFIGADSCDNAGLDAGEHCVKELVNHLYTQDQSDLKQKQVVRTHTIGFNFSSQWLADVAEAGGGLYKEATRSTDLVEELESILSDVLRVNSTFVAPVAAINQFNRMNHRSEIYFAVFRPDDTPAWPGNLKKYRLSAQDNAVLDFSDEVGQPAIDSETGFFSENAVSAWGGVVDGPVVDVGGANSQMPAYATRKLYTYYTGSTSDNLSSAANVVETTNNNLTRSMFNVDSMSDTEFDEHIEWILGRDVDDEDDDGSTLDNRYLVGDPLHSKPVAVTYGGTDQDPDITIFFGSNNGLLHAVDAETGQEQFAFLPEDSMASQIVLRERSLAEAHIYGIDGSVTPWVNDANADGEISGDGEFVRLFFGQRRGGRNYWALDVTDRNNPRLLWQIKGGTGDYVEMGQSWAQPILGAVNIDGTLVDVLYISGGYDPDQDDTDIRAVDDMGRAVYVVNALTGELVWSGGDGANFSLDLDDMKYSIPAELTVLDIDNSGTDDMLFVGDMGGQVWRFDIRNGQSAANLVSGGVIADLGVAAGANNAVDNRRFYHSPDAALMFEDGEQKLAISLGSGYRAHPLSEETVDRFYLIDQGPAFRPADTYVKLTEADLYDATDNDVGEGVEGARAAMSAKQGWYFDLPNAGEKVLSTPLTFRNTITFTTYTPNAAYDTTRCLPQAGTSRVYQVAMADARPVNDWDDIAGLTETDRGTELRTNSIIDEPVIVCTGAGCDMFVGAEKPPIDKPRLDRVVKTAWRAREK